jgi:hypothetical protein
MVLVVVSHQVSPYNDKAWWTHTIERPMERGDPQARDRLLLTLSGLMWRNSKRSVKDQLGLPPQRQITKRLNFSMVERHFYRTQHTECQKKVKLTHFQEMRDEVRD